jgi:hypothetical protein
MNSQIYKKVLLSNLKHDLKIKALEDIMIMQISEAYRKHTFFDFDCEVLHECFAFNKSVLGFDFWMNISDLIDSDLIY